MGYCHIRQGNDTVQRNHSDCGGSTVGIGPFGLFDPAPASMSREVLVQSYSLEVLPRRAPDRDDVSSVVPSPPKMAAIALRLVCASRSISARIASAFFWMSGSALVFSIQCSKATRISSVVVLPVS